MQLISFSSVGWSTKYYLHYPATLISPPWCQVLMTQVIELQSALTPVLTLWVIILSHTEHGHLLKHKYYYWGQKTLAHILMKPR